MSSFEITRDEDTITGSRQSTAFEMNVEKETIFFWKSKYTWDQLIEIVEYIQEHRELNKEVEEAPF